MSALMPFCWARTAGTIRIAARTKRMERRFFIRPPIWTKRREREVSSRKLRTALFPISRTVHSGEHEPCHTGRKFLRREFRPDLLQSRQDNRQFFKDAFLWRPLIKVFLDESLSDWHLGL